MAVGKVSTAGYLHLCIVDESLFPKRSETYIHWDIERLPNERNVSLAALGLYPARVVLFLFGSAGGDSMRADKL